MGTLILRAGVPVQDSRPFGEARRFIAEPNAMAARLLKEATLKLRDAGVRTRLAELYGRLGYKALQRLFAVSADAAGGRISEVHVPRPVTAWVCSEGPGDSQRLVRLSDKIHAKLVAGNYSAARRLAEDLIRVENSPCELLIKWSEVVIRQAMLEPSKVNWEVREEAMRILVTGTSELGLIPAPFAGVTSAYETLADYFVASGDEPSAVAALGLAADCVRADPFVQDKDRQAEERRLTERMNHLLTSIKQNGP